MDIDIPCLPPLSTGKRGFLFHENTGKGYYFKGTQWKEYQF